MAYRCGNNAALARYMCQLHALHLLAITTTIGKRLISIMAFGSTRERLLGAARRIYTEQPYLSCFILNSNNGPD